MGRGRPSGPQALRTVLLSVLALLLLASRPPASAWETGRVVDVADGDTLFVRIGNSVRTVRLIGIDAPEKSHPRRGREFLADEATQHLATLCRGKIVRLERDREDLDRHGRLLRYVFLSESPETPSPLRRGEPAPGGKLSRPEDEVLVNLEMVRRGYARTIRRFPFSRAAAFLEAEDEARREGRGLWRDGGLAELRWLRDGRAAPAEIWASSGGRFAVVFEGMARTGIPRDDLADVAVGILRLRTELSDREFEEKAREKGFRPLAPPGPGMTPSPSSPLPLGEAKTAVSTPVPWDEAQRHVGRSVTTEGTIVRTHRVKSALFLNFHPNWKRYVTVVIFARDLKRFPKDAHVFYKGKTVRVTGEVTLYKDRPEIVVRTPDAIEVIGSD
jgi:endonuclease YncB( thermonuclease family)